MIFVKHPTNNMELKPPEDWDHTELPCETLHVTLLRDPAVICSFWRPDAEELAALQAGYPLVLMVYGPAHPVVAMGVENAGFSFGEP